ncbi:MULTISPECIES: class I adenylate-forming enzyme family protein [unclassified Solwaraspora]|uniref:class I adenylate-forming enzyme family protein n=1 Tax=unclassified Solwaraspora TaxID=2627926 RepID=UPI00248B6085|nr:MULTISPECIES: class I adenylate-forming enzyme family protein [unclassified Solwaraspora]WBB99066.1 class I adenylate-forming enzyme family protein [Solwaraspora sp. WMMA2059]WBC22381.1 class I adenylate-forming enzyme family protein [Solwaraspora sp. WMMA2080]WJK35570.1 class I adenylate-forming enzyme family protein [Solwaraspora sp. WMMA2065]
MLDRLAATLRADPHRPAVLTATALTGRCRVRATTGDLTGLTDRYAATLARHGLAAGDTLGLAVRPGLRSLAVLLAAYHLGVRVAVLDPTAGPDVLTARLAVAEPALVLADSVAQAVAGWAGPLARRAHLALPDLTRIAPVRTVGRRLPGCAPALPAGTGPLPAAFDGDGDAVIVFTSGTTSRPRAVVHTRAGLSAGMRAVTGLVGPQPDVPVLGGTFFVLVPALAAGAPVALPARSPSLLARQLIRLRPQATYLTPPQLRAVLEHSPRLTGRVFSGSAPVSAALLGRVKRAGADRAYGVYALTELFPAAAVEEADKRGYAADGDLVGRPLAGVTARVDDTGQVRLSGPGQADRYLGEPPMAEVATGDVGRLDGDRLVLAGRCKDMVLRAAENIYPGLYEPALHVPGVALAVLVGVPADDGDERLVAVVQPEPGADRARLRVALRPVLDRMGSARPDRVVFARVPLAGRSRKPDRQAAAQVAAQVTARAAARVAGDG